MSSNAKIALLTLLFSIIFSSIGLVIEYYAFVQPKIENLQIQLSNVGLTVNTLSSNVSYNKKILFTNSNGTVVGCIIVSQQGSFQMYGSGIVLDMRTIDPCK